MVASSPDDSDDSLVAQLAVLGTEARTLTEFRAAALSLLRQRVPFDRAAFHAFSPRVPLETGVFVELDLAVLAGSVSQWDTFAVELGRMRDLANTSGVAWDREAFPPGSASRARFLELIGAKLRVRSMLMVHLVVRARVTSAIALFGKRDDAFEAHHVAFLQRAAPTLALSDALLQHDGGAPRASLPTKLACEDGRLTPRQRQIVEHVALGHTNAEIARAMGLSANTLRNHLAAIFTRVGASNRADLVRLAVLTPA